MSDQLSMEVERPLTFVVKAWDGTIIDAFTEDDLVTHTHDPSKTWGEAAAWAYLAWSNYRKLNPVSRQRDEHD